jgi:hypothetical protein
MKKEEKIMKTKKIVIGAMAAAMLSLSVCSIAPAVAADETVQISVGKTTAEAGGQFTVDVSMADIPSTGIQCCEFSIKYDSAVIKITDVKAGKLASSVSGDSSASLLPSFNSYAENEGLISVMWSTSVDSASSWITGEGTFCTISGTVASNAAPGAVAEISVVPTDRETHSGSSEKNTVIDCGYTKDGAKVPYAVKATAGSVTVAGGETTTTTQPVKVVRGDANEDGSVTVADAVAILQYIGNKDKYNLSAQGKLNADVDDNPGVTPNDALTIQKFDAGVITTL